MKYLIDTNVLLRFFDLEEPGNADIVVAIDTLTALTAETYVCAQVLIEYWVAATRPVELNGFGLDCSQADLRLAQIETLFTCLPEPPEMARLWRELVRKYRVIGKKAHDARLVVLMQAHNVSHIVTLNVNDFARYSGITPITPQEIIDQRAV